MHLSNLYFNFYFNKLSSFRKSFMKSFLAKFLFATFNFTLVYIYVILVKKTYLLYGSVFLWFIKKRTSNCGSLPDKIRILAGRFPKDTWQQKVVGLRKSVGQPPSTPVWASVVIFAWQFLAGHLIRSILLKQTRLISRGAGVIQP